MENQENPPADKRFDWKWNWTVLR